MSTPDDFSQLTGTYELDPAHTRVGFVTRHAMVTKVRGAFNDVSGTAELDGNKPGQSSVRLRLQTASIDTRNGDRDGHLRGTDFLNVEEYPTIAFTSTDITETGENSFDVTGDLTIKDVTRSVTVPVSFEGQAVDPFGATRVGFEGSTTINRKDFGITWNAALETGGVLVGDKVTIELEISAVKQG